MSDRAIGIYGQCEQCNSFQHFTSGCEQQKAESWEEELVSEALKMLLHSGSTFQWQILTFLACACGF